MFPPARFAWLTLAVLGVAALASVGHGQDKTAGKPKDLRWSHAFDLAARKFGEADFTEKTTKFGVEAFRDDNNGLGVYLSEKGGVALGTNFPDTKGSAGGKGPEWLTGLDLPARKAG